MLDSLRRGAKSWVAKVLIILLIGSFAVWGIGDIFSFRLDSTVATVGETDIPAQRYADAMIQQRNVISQRAGQLVSYEDMRALGMDRRVLSSLIRDAAMAEETRRLGLAAPDEAVAKAIREMPELQDASGKFSVENYALMLNRRNIQTSEFEALMRNYLIEQILLNAASQGVASPPGLAQRLAAWQGEERDVAVLTLTPEMADAPAAPGEEALQAFYDEHPDMFTRPERRWGRYLFVDPKALEAELAPSEEEARAIYDSQTERFTEVASRTIEQLSFPDRAAAEAAVKRLKAGEVTFAELATELGENPADISLGTVRPEDLPEAVSKAVFAVTEPGIVGPVEAPLGIVVLNVTAVTEGGVKPFEAVRDQIIAEEARDAAYQRAPEIANQIEELRAGGASFEEIAAESGATLGQFGGLARDGSLADGGRAAGTLARQDVADEIFTALDGEERDIAETREGGYFLVMVDRIEESNLPPLDEIRDEVAKAWVAEERLKSLETKAEALAKRLNAGELIYLVAAELGTPVRETGAFTRLTAPRDLAPPLVSRIFAARDGEALAGRAADGSGVQLVKVIGITPLDPDVMQAQSAQIERLIVNSISQDQAEYFSRAIIRRYNVQIDQETMGQVFDLLVSGGN